MKRLDLWYGRPWALLPAKMDEMQRAVDALMAGVQIPEFVAGKSGNRAEGQVEVAGGVAVVPVYGVLDSKANMMDRVSGGTSYQLLARDILRAASETDVDAIVLDVDSPGGSTDGLMEVVSAVREARTRKPVVAYSGGHMTSAAYWIGSAASKVVVAPQALVGSIGVRMVHTDRSAADEADGIKRTEIYAGKYKSAGSDTAPLDEESRAYLQGMADRLHTVFVEAVATQRAAVKLTVADVLGMGAHVFVGADAVDRRLADQVGDLTAAKTLARKEMRMDRNTLKAEHPDTFQAVHDEGRAAAAADLEKATTEAAAAATEAERARCVALLDACGVGAESPVVAAMSEGAEPGAFALQMLKAEREGKAGDLKRVAASLAPPVPPAPSAKPEGGGQVIDFMQAVAAYREQHECSQAEAVRAVAREQPALQAAYASGRRQSKPPKD